MIILGIVLVFLWSHSHVLSVPTSSLPLVQTLFAKVGDSIELDCSAVRQSSTEISWYKHGAPLLEITYRKLDDQMKSRKLLLDNLLLADSGNYTCCVNNTLGPINRTFALRVYESSSSYPIILKSLLFNRTAIHGSETTFHCHVTGDSVTYVRWYFKGNTVGANSSSNLRYHGHFVQIKNVLPVKVFSIADNNNSGHRFRGEAVYVVQNVSFKDEGEYLCEAFNERGKTKCGAFLAVVKGPSPSARELESRYTALFEQKQNIPLAFLVAVPIALLVVLMALFVRALERAKQRYGFGLKGKTDRNKDVVVFRKTSCNGNKESSSQEIENNMIISTPRLASRKVKCNSVHITGRQITPLLKNVLCETTPYSWDRPPSCDTSDVSSKRCSVVEELEWEGIDLVMVYGFEKIKLSKEEEV